MKKVNISNDLELFDSELNAYEYEFFCKHTGAFKRLMMEEPKEQKQKFLDAFCKFNTKYGETKFYSTMDDKMKYVETFKKYAQEIYIDGKFSAAKQFLNDAVTISRNKHMIHYMDTHSYVKDPFFHKETRDVFRRLFGSPSEAGTCMNVICLLPLYVKFAGAMCRYLRMWLDVEEPVNVVKLSTKTRKGKKRDEKTDPDHVVKQKMDHSRDKGGTSQISQGLASGAKTSGVKNSVGKSSEGSTSEGKVSERLRSKSKTAENKTPGNKTSESKTPATKTSKVTTSGGKTSENNRKITEGKTSESRSSKDDVQAVTCDGKISVDRTYEKETSEGKITRGKTSIGKTSEGATSEGKLAEGRCSGFSSSESDSADERYIRKVFPQLHLGEPHPNEVYDKMVEEKRKARKKVKNSSEEGGGRKLRTCAFCGEMENEARSFKKCQKCKGKGTKFYCSRDCQKSDWPKHRIKHQKET